MSRTRPVSNTCYYILLILFFSLILLVNMAEASVYKWVDEYGKIQFSDKAPENEKSDVKIQNYATDAKKTAIYSSGNKDVKLLEPKRYTLSVSSRRVVLEKVLVDIPEQTLGTNASIGKIFTVKADNKKLVGCGSSKSVIMLVNHAQILLNESPLRNSFHSMFRSFGYDSIDTQKTIFANQENESAEISVAAIIKEINVVSCSQEYSTVSADARTSTYLKIEWKVFDNLTRKTIYNATTEGYDDGFDKAVRTRGNLVSFTTAFTNAGQNFLADDQFIKLLQPEVSSNVRSTDVSKDTPLKLKLRAGVNGTQFARQVKALQKGTVTVRIPQGHGSGFLITKNLVLTNYHVVEGQSRVMIVNDGIEFNGRVFRVDNTRDVALIQLSDNSDFNPLAISSIEPETGEIVYVIGTPLDEKLGHSVSQGIMSSERIIEKQRYFQTDAAINHGNSGGPAFDAHGNVIGIAVAANFSKDGGSLNIGYLIPINEALKSLKIEKE